MSDFKFGTAYQIDTIPDEYKVAEHSMGKRVMLFCPNEHYPDNSWSFGRWDTDVYNRRVRPFWRMECFYSITDSRSNQPTHWMPLPPGVNDDRHRI